MSALGQKQTLQRILVMSALPPKADIGTQSWNVRFVPEAEVASHAVTPTNPPLPGRNPPNPSLVLS
jgi:hypothetical protein